MAAGRLRYGTVGPGKTPGETMCAAGFNESILSVCVCVYVHVCMCTSAGLLLYGPLAQARPQGRRQVLGKINSNRNKWVNAYMLSLCVCVTPGCAAVRPPWHREDSTTRQESSKCANG